MKAACIHHYGQKNIEIANMMIPKIRDHDVLIKIVAASINPIDFKIQHGQVKLLLNYSMPLILGNDLAGIVVKVGKNVHRFKEGDAVYGRVQKNRIGTFAQYIAAHENDFALKPKNLSFIESASIPLVGLTAYQALFDFMNVQANDKVFIPAGSGGVGSIAIQLAKLRGAYVATTTSAKNSTWVKNLGADEVIDYQHQHFQDILSDYNYVFDTIGGTTLNNAFKIVKPQSKIVSISALPTAQFGKAFGLPLWKQWLFWLATYKIRKMAKQSQTTYEFLFMQSNHEQLEKLKQWLEEGKIRPIIDRVIPLDHIQEAFNYAQSGHAKGKIIIQIDDELAETK